MLAKLAVLTMTLFSSMTYGQVPETFTVRDQVYTRGNLLRETRIELVNGEVLYKEKGTHEKSMVVPDTGGKPVILVVSGTGKTTDGREFDAHYLTDSKDELLVLEFLGHVGRSPKGDQFIGLPRAYSAGHSYASLGWTLPDRTLKIRQVNNQYMNFEKFVAYYLASGSFTVGVYEAVTGKRLTVEMVDAHAFNDPTIEISKGPTGGFPISSTTDDQLQRFASIAAGVSKIAADGVTLLLVRTEVPEAGTVTYQVDGGGTILPLTGDPFTASEASSLRVRSKPVTLLNGIHNYAFALYRAPPMVIKSRTSNFSINASFKSNVESTQSISGDVSGTLVRPPVVLVHGTYDNPKECWQTKDPDDAPQTMYQRLTDAGFRVFCVDWEKTNGREDPSDFATNTLTVLNNKDGILDALAAYRRDGIAVTQVDIVAHSQGGVITRVFARGSNDSLIDANHRHIKDKQACRASACWYHTKRNFGQGDIRRFITISSTHMGSDIPGLFRGITAVRDKSPADGATAKIFTNVVDALQYWMTGVKTGGFKDQMPGSAALNRIGPTPIKSHAIAVVCSDQIMETRKSGFYVGRLKKLWTAIPRFAIEPVFSAIGNTPGGEKMFAAAKNYADLGITDDTAVPYRDLLREFRKTVFWGEENDCVVSFSSSCGGLKGKYITKIDGYVHSFGPRETEVQVRVLELLSGPEDPFDPNGFPDSYDGKTLKTRGASDTGAGKGTKPVADNPIKPELPKTDINLKGALPPAAQDALKKAQELISQSFRSR